MSNFLIQKTMFFIKNNSNYSEKELLKISYGMEGILLTIAKVLVILLIGIIFNYLDVVILTMVFFNMLRFFSFGLHAKKSIHCLIISIIEFNILPYIFLQIKLSLPIIWTIFGLSLISFLLFAPADTEKRPLTNKIKRRNRKILSIITLLTMMFIALKVNYLTNTIMVTFLIADFSINPLSYKLLGLPYRNYKKLA